MKKEIKRMILSVGALTLLCVTVFCPVPCRCAVLWSEDFDDPPDGWKLDGCDADEGWLRINDTKFVLGDPVAIANCSSTVAEGTWEFDLVELGRTGGWLGVWFMANGSDFATSNYYAVQLTRSSTATGSIPVFGLYRNFEGAKVKLASYDGPESPLGAHNIAVTRNSAGQIRVSVNGTPAIDVTDTNIDESTYFVFWDYIMDTALDNVVVSDEVWPPPPPWWWLVIGAGGVIFIVVAVIVLKRKR